MRASRRVIYLRGPGSLRLVRCQLEMAARCLPPDGRMAVLDPQVAGRPGMETDAGVSALIAGRGITILPTVDKEALQGFLA